MSFHGFDLLTLWRKSAGVSTVVLLQSLFIAPHACSAFTPVSGTTYRLENQANGLCGLANLYGSYGLALNSFMGNPAEYMVFNAVGSSYFTIGHQGETTVLQDNGGSLSQAASSGQYSQQWYFKETGGGWVAIYNRATGNVLNGTYTNHDDTTSAPWANASSQKWWVDPVHSTQQQCIAVAAAYDVTAPKRIVICSNSYLGATVSGTLNGAAISFGYQSPPSGYNTLWGQYYYTNKNPNIATSAGAYTVAVPGFPSASFSVSDDAYRQIPSATSRQSGVNIGVQDIINGFFRGQHRQEDETLMPMYVYVPNTSTLQPIAGTGGPHVNGGWKDATSVDVEMGQEAITLRNLAFAVLDARDSGDASALRNEVAYGASFFLSGIQNIDGSFPIKIAPAADTPATAKPKLVMNDNVGSTAKCVAGLAAASLVLQRSNPGLAAQCLTAAKNGFTWVKQHQNVYIDSRVPNFGQGNWVGSADSILDAAIGLAITTHDSTCISDAKYFFNDGQFNADGAWVARSGAYTYQWSGLHAAIALARWTQDSSLDGDTRGNVFKQLRAYYGAVSGKINTPFGTNSNILNAYFGWSPHYMQEALTYANLYRAFGLSSMLEKARDQYDWLAGVNPFNSSFIIGAGNTNIWPQYNRPRQDSIGELIPGAWAAQTGPYDPLIGSIGINSDYINGCDYGFGEGVVGDTSFLPANMMLMDSIVNTPIINTPIGNHTYQIINLNSGDLLDVKSNALYDGASIDQYPPTGGNNQKWTLVDLHNGYWEILSVSSQKCLEVPNASLSALLDQSGYRGSNFQQWSFIPFGDGSYQLVNRGSGLAVDVRGASTTPGALVNQYNYYSGDNQRWILNASPNPVDLSTSYNCNGIGADGAQTSSGGLDGGNYTISGNQIGVHQIWNGATFNIGPIGQNNVVTAKGQTISLPGNYSSLRVFAEAVNGPATNQSITLQYAAGSPSTFTQSFSDWANPQNYSGEANVISTYRNSASGGRDCNIMIYGYTFALDNTRPVVSVTLPNNGNLKIIAVTLAP